MSIVDILSETLSQLNLNSRSLPTSMAQEQNNTLQQIHLTAVPRYDGNPSTLAIFISSCEYLLTTFGSSTPGNTTNELLLRLILSKLEGRALTLIGSREDATSWVQIKTLLYQYFGDQRDENCLIRDLMALRPRRNETAYQFGVRCQDVRSLLQSRLKLKEADVTVRTVKNNLYDDLALQTFLQGLPRHLSLPVRLRNPQNLEVAMSLVIEEENFLYAQQRSHPALAPRSPHPTPQRSYSNSNMTNHFSQQQIRSPPPFTQHAPNQFNNQQPQSSFSPSVYTQPPRQRPAFFGQKQISY